MSDAAITTPRLTQEATSSSKPAGRGPRIAFFGLFGSGNFGNDGSLKAMIELVRRGRPDAELVCYCSGPERVRQTFGIEAAAISASSVDGVSRIIKRLLALVCMGGTFLRALALTRKVDALIVPGTGILDDFCSGPLGIPLEIFTWCLAARLTRTPIWFVSIGAGPIVHPLSYRLMVWAAALAHYRSYRDTNSKLFLSKAGVDTQGDLVFPDIAFQLPRPDGIPVRSPTEPLTVGIGVMEYWGWKDSSETSSTIHATYQDRLSHFCIWLLEKGCRIRLLPGDDSDDRAICALRSLLEARLGDPSLMRNVLAEPAHDLADVMKQMAATDVVVATRFHNIVCALKMGKPTLSLSYAEKNAALLEEAGLGDCAQHVEGFDIEQLKAQFERLIADRATLTQSIAAFSALTRKRLQRQEQLLSVRLQALAPRAGRIVFDKVAGKAASEPSATIMGASLRAFVPDERSEAGRSTTVPREKA